MTNSCTTKKLAFFLLLSSIFLYITMPVFAAENITEVKIDNLPVIVKAGTRLDFSFLVGNREGEACNAEIAYWIGDMDNKTSQGTDTIYLAPGQVETVNASLLVPSNMSGVQNFYLQMQCNETVTLANKTIEVRDIIPTMPQFGTLEISAKAEEEQLEFSYQLESNQPEPVPIHLEESILKDGNVVWTSSQNIPLAGSTSLKRFGPVLQPGKYKLVVEASSGKETARIVREFTVRPAALPIIPMATAAMAVLGLLLFVGIGAGVRYITTRKHFVRAVPSIVRGRKEFRNRICPVESESSGTLNSYSLHSLLDNAGFKGKRRETAIRFAESNNLVQIVRGCIVTDKQDRMQCETTVTVTVSNNSNRNWTKLVLLAEIPEFLAEKPSQIEADCEMHSVKGEPIARFLLPKVGAMQSASISYKSARMVSQAEANSIPLPALVRYRESKPLVIAQVKVEKSEEEEKLRCLLHETKKKKVAKKIVSKKGKRKKKRQ